MNDDERMTPIQVRLPLALLQRIDAYRSKLRFKPSRAQTIRGLIENSMNQLESKEGQVS